MTRPPLWLWLCVCALGLGVIYADLRRDAEIAELDALRTRVAAAERALSVRCFIARSPNVIAEVRR